MKIHNLFLIIIFFLLIVNFSSISYANKKIDYEFDVKILDIYKDENQNYLIDLKFQNNLKGKTIYNIEIIYDKTNLVINQENFFCINNCVKTLKINKIIFDNYKIFVLAKNNNDIFQKELNFKLEYEKPKQNYFLNLKKDYEIRDGKLNIDGTIDLNSRDEEKITIEVYPKSAPNNRIYESFLCKNKCYFNIKIKSEIVIDEYIVNFYSRLGETQKSINVNLENPLKKQLLQTPFDLSSEISNKILHNNKNKVTKNIVKVKNKNLEVLPWNINDKEFVDLEINFLEKNVKKIKVKNTTIKDTNIGFEYIETKKVSDVNPFSVNAFAIDPYFSENVKEFELTFIAKGTEILKCEDYDFKNQNCFGEYFKLMNTIPGREYTITLTPKDPIFVEVFMPKIEIQRGLISNRGNTLSTNINQINQSQSFILFNTDISTNTPKDIQFTPDFINDNSISFNRYDGANIDSNLAWQTITSNLFYVQRGNINFPIGSSSINVQINNINTSSSFAIIYGRCNSNSNSANNAGFFYGNITNSTNLNIVRGNEGKCDSIVNYQVIDFNTAKIQKGSIDFENTGTQITSTLSSSTTLSNSLLFFNYASIGDDAGMDTNMIRGDLNTPNTVVFNRIADTGNSIRKIVYYVVEYENFNIQRGLTTFGSSTTQSISNVNMTNTFVIDSNDNSGGGEVWRNTLYSLTLANQNLLDFIKSTTQQTINSNWIVSEFIPPSPPDFSGEITLTADSEDNIDTNNLTCSYTPGDDVENVLINWYLNGNNIYKAVYPFNGNSTNALLDFSSNNNHLTNNGAIWESGNGFNGGGAFNLGSTNNYLSIPPLNLNSNNITITARIKRDGSQNLWAGIVFTRGGSSIAGINFGNSNELRYHWNDDPNSWGWNSNLIVPDNIWTFIALVINPNNATLYMNNNHASNLISHSIEEFDFNTYIGWDSTDINRNFNGLIDDVRIYDRALSFKQIDNIYLENDNQLSFMETIYSQIWQCSVTPFNYKKVGDEYFSNNLLINIGNISSLINTSIRTCTDSFGGEYCGLWPASSEGDNTFDDCPSSRGGVGDENVREVYLNATTLFTGDTLGITCEFDPYSTGTEEYIYYYNGTGWKQLYSGNAPGSEIHNVSTSVILDDIEGTHWLRCIVDWVGQDVPCAQSSSYFDNDDASIEVIKRPIIPVTLEIIKPENKTYLNPIIPLEFLTGKNSTISYSINNQAFVTACTNCTYWSSSLLFRNGNNNLKVRAIEDIFGFIYNKEVNFFVNYTPGTAEPQNTTMRTCTNTFGGEYCGLWPASSEGDNTFDDCPTSRGGIGDEHVREVYINSSLVYAGDSVEITCEFDPYSTGTEEYIYYYNGTGWKQLYSGNAPGSDVHNITVTTTVDSYDGTHWFRCIVDWEGQDVPCAQSSMYFDNDDASLEVRVPIVLPFMLSIIAPQNTIYPSSIIPFEFTTTKSANISYSLNGGLFTNLCSNCTYYESDLLIFSQYNFLEVRAIDFINGDIIYENVSFEVNITHPQINNINLHSSLYLNTTNENLVCNLSNNIAVENYVVNWFENYNSITHINMPFEGNFTNALLDFSSNNNHASLYGNTVWINNASQNLKGAFYFDGDNDYLNFGDIDSMDIMNEFTISIWFKRENDVGSSTNHNVNNVLLAQSSQNNNDNLEIGTSGTNIQLYIDTAGTDSFTFDAGIQNNKWYHLVVNYDSSRTNELELYLNGTLITQWNTPQGALSSSNNAPLSIGVARADRADPTGDFNGYISEVVVFNKALSQEQIENIFLENTIILSSTQTNLNELWQCSATPFSSWTKGNTIFSSILEIIEPISTRNVNLNFKKNITYTGTNNYLVNLFLQNLDINPTPQNKNVIIYFYIDEHAFLTSPIYYTNSNWYNVSITNSSLSNILFGNIYQLELIPKTPDLSSLDGLNETFINSNNSINIWFNITGNYTYHYSNKIIAGFDPQLN